MSNAPVPYSPSSINIHCPGTVVPIFPERNITSNNKSSQSFQNLFSDDFFSKIPTQTPLSDLPRDLNITKVEVLHPTRGWEKANLKDVRYLQSRNITDEQLTQMLKADLTVEEAAKAAKGIPNLEGKNLAKNILQASKVNNLKTSQGLGFFETIKRNFNSWLTHQAQQKTVNPTLENENNPEKLTIEGNEDFNFANNKTENSVWDRKVYNSVTPSLVQDTDFIVDNDYNFLNGEKDLSDQHLAKLTEERVGVGLMIATAKVFPNLKGDELFEKIHEGYGRIPESPSFKNWEKNPFRRCSWDGVKGQENRPKALILQAQNFNFNTGSLEIAQTRDLFQRLHEVYNVCFRLFHNLESFFSGITRHSQGMPINLLFVMAHGEQNSIIFSPGNKVSTRTIREYNNYNAVTIFSRLHPTAHVILHTCHAGEGRERENNVANFFNRISPPEARIYASSEKVNKLTIVLTRDSENSLRANFWFLYDRGINCSLMQNCIDDTTYETD